MTGERYILHILLSTRIMYAYLLSVMCIWTTRYLYLYTYSKEYGTDQLLKQEIQREISCCTHK